MLMLMPPSTSASGVLPREVIFVIDSSGSMKGVSMPHARKSLLLGLARLKEHDTFNIIDFDSSARKLFNTPQPASREKLALAENFVRSLRADGGTNMAQALDLALAGDAPTERLRQVVFITDGSVGNEYALFKKIAEGLGSTRLFTVGIGSAPNTLFMRKAAQFGRGTFTYIDPGSSIKDRMLELFNQLERPSLRDIQVEWPAGMEVEQLPEKIPDLYYGEPLIITARTPSGQASVTINGMLPGRKWQRDLHAGPPQNETGIATIWAGNKVDALFDSMVTGVAEPVIKPQIIELALEHNLLTKYTSFVAVEEKPVRPEGEEAKDKQIANLMPRGNRMAVPFPATATTATMSFYLGMLFLVLAILFHYRYRPKC